MWRQVAKLTCQLANVKSLSDDEKSDHGFMTNFENSFQRHDQRKQFLDQDEYDVETER